MIGQRRRANLVLYPRNKSAERLHNLNCRENVQMARIADKVKRVANFLGLYLRKMGYSYLFAVTMPPKKFVGTIHRFAKPPTDVTYFNIRF